MSNFKRFCGFVTNSVSRATTLQNLRNDINPLSANSTKMVKHTQTIRWQQPANCLSVGLALKGLTLTF